jgi:hypothetical protein
VGPTNGGRVEWHLLKPKFRIFVIPAQAGIQEYRHHQASWIPAYAGMTVVLGLSKCHSGQSKFTLHAAYFYAFGYYGINLSA